MLDERHDAGAVWKVERSKTGILPFQGFPERIPPKVVQNPGPPELQNNSKSHYIRDAAMQQTAPSLKNRPEKSLL